MASKSDNGAKRLKAMMENYLEARRDGHKYGYEIRLVEPDNYEHYYILVEPIAGVYKGQKYLMEMKTTYGLGDDKTTYPNNAPYIRFITNIFHVNISANGGSICLDILKDKDRWSPLNSFDTIIQNILLLFNEPNNGSPYNGSASKLWVECGKDYDAMKTGKMTVQDADELYVRCFRPFINEAERVMRTNDYKKYAKWFPELDQLSPEYTNRVKDNELELAELADAFEHIKLAKKKHDTSTNPDESLKPEDAKKKRWAKYQK